MELCKNIAAGINVKSQQFEQLLFNKARKQRGRVILAKKYITEKELSNLIIYDTYMEQSIHMAYIA